MQRFLLSCLTLFFIISLAQAKSSSNVQQVEARIMFSESSSLKKRVFGIHGELLWSPIRLGDPLLVKIYNDVGFQDIRLPGGAAGNLYLSQSGKFGCNKPDVSKEVKIRIKKFNESLSHNNRTYSTKDFLSFIKGAKTNFTLIIDVLCDTPDNTRKWMEEIRNSGVTVKYVEMGSEYYFKKYLWAFPTPEDYIKQAKAHALEVRKVFPDVKIGIDTSSSSYRSKYFPDFSKMKENERYKRGLEFDKLAASASFANAFDVHIYSPLGMTRMDEILDTINDSQAYKNAVRYFDNRFKPSMQYLHKLNPDKKIWITEWGVAFYGWQRKHEPEFLKSYYNALYVTNSILTYFSIPYIESADYHNFPYLWSDFKKLVPNPLYYAMKFFKEPISVSSTVVPVNFTALKFNHDSNNDIYTEIKSDLNGMMFYNNTEGTLFIVNKFSRHYSLALFSSVNGNINMQPINIKQIVPDMSIGSKFEKVIQYNKIFNKQTGVNILPYSITKIHFKIKPDSVPVKQVKQ